MSSRTVLESQQSAIAPTAGRVLAGSWKLDAGRAITLNPRERSVLEISQGRVWLAVGARPGQADQGTQDMVLVRGQSLVIEPGQQVVMESWYLRGGAPSAVAFCWDSVPATRPAADPALDWELGVAQPLRDLVCALGQGGRAVGSAVAATLGASGRLVAGLVRLALHRVGRVINHFTLAKTCSAVQCKAP
ncbi:DUF2917 domain-containing protein [Acidovorax sp. LjRoot66]|uniref:DUF2917 domain-containing protein n=1 Tax=Acidovorax sp. LjRoot66 TaxID=3342334 RepID=UPI003ED0F5E0